MATKNESTFDVAPAAEMEAEERELVIKNSVDDLETYSELSLTDKEIEQERLHLKDIKPKPEDQV